MSNTKALKKKSLFQRVVSTFLAMMMAIMCMPASLFEAAALGFGFGPGSGFGWGGPNVLTNASVKFKDAATNKVIGEVESGETFKQE